MTRLPLFIALSICSVGLCRADFIIDDFTTSTLPGPVLVAPNNASRVAEPTQNGNPGGAANLAIGGGNLAVTNAINTQGFRADYTFSNAKNFFDLTNKFRVVFDADATSDAVYEVRLIAFASGTGTSTINRSYDNTGLAGLQSLFFDAADFSDPTILKSISGIRLDIRKSGNPTPVNFLLTQGLVAVPEPASLLLSLGGMLAVGGGCFVRRRLRKSQETEREV